MTKKHDIDKFALVKFDYDSLAEEYHKHFLTIFPKDEVFVFMGEIKQMPGHCIVCNYATGVVLCGYHTDNFIMVDE